MKHKILVADDSLTIQKVIKITLASEPFELVECLDAHNLNSQVEANKPNIVLLDFNLSEDKTGYDLAHDIKSIVPNAKILMLYGTFDTIDEDLLTTSGVNHKIVKPFDGTKFINLCRVMSEDLGLENAETINSTEHDFSTDTPVELPAVIEEDSFLDDEEDEWVMDSPYQEEELPEEINFPSEPTTNSLEANMKEWGMDVPGIIGRDSDHIEIPDIISESEEFEMSSPVQVIEETVMPSDEDLAYPSEIINSEPEPELVRLDDIDDLEPVMEEEDEIFGNNGAGTGTETEEDLENLKSLIEDEVEEDNLWNADEYDDDEDDFENDEDEEEVEISFVDDLPRVEPHRLHEIKIEDLEETKQVPSDFPADVMEERDEKTASFTDTVQFRDELKEKLRPMIEEFVKDYCQEHIEKIAWEVIPDLAENLIRKEIKKITNSIINS